jgi:hypothetical protein
MYWGLITFDKLHTAEALVPDPIFFEDNMNRY